MSQKLQGFVGQAYQLDSVNVDAQRCVNLYPEVIQSQFGKGGQPGYLRSTSGLLELAEAGDGPIRMVHRDYRDRTFVASGNELFRVSKSDEWTISIDSDVYDKYQNPTVAREGAGFIADTGTDILTTQGVNYDWHTGQKCTVYLSTGTLPVPLAEDTDYYIINVDTDQYRLATSMANAAAGTYIDITTAGTGNFGLSTNDPAPFEVNLTTEVDYSTDEFTETAHGYYSGASVQVTNQAFPLPTGLAFSTDYYVIVVDSDTFKLATSLSNALAGTAIDVTFPSGTWSATNVLADEFDPSLGDFTFSTSTGTIHAASMSYGGDGEDSSTIFVDGSFSYIFYDLYGLRLCFERTDVPASLGVLDFGDNVEASHIVWIDGYFIINEVGTNKFYVSDLQGFTIDSLSFASSEGSPDLVVGVLANNRDLFIFNEFTTEIFVNTGNPDFPFERVQGGFIEMGCMAKHSIARIKGTFCWLGQDQQGGGAVYMMNGYTPQKISTHVIEQKIASYANPENGTAFGYEWKGHYFYVLNFSEATWVYDLATGIWHERAYTNSGDLERHLVEAHAYDTTHDIHIVGDYGSGEIYQFDDDTYDDDGDAITRLRTCPHISNTLEQIVCDQLQLDMEAGVGLASGQGSDPQVMLDWSDDGGHTWSDESWTSAGGQTGGIGEYSTRVIWRRLGRFRDRVFRFKITDPVKVVFIDAWMKLRAGFN